ncbi:MAG: hypothetical protein FJ318_10165 [SAR202 cluster bacterium]|nr:hypothetical protein [SAR202 cluster bacterium]
MIQRMVRSAKLDPHLYEEVEADTGAMSQALIIVAIVALITAVGVSRGGIGDALLGIVLGIVGWALWAAITYFVGAKLLPTPQTHADWGQMLRVLGFAQSVGVLRVLGVIPGVGALLLFIVLLWQIAAMVVAVRQALDYTSTLRAVAVVIIGAIPYMVLLFLLSGLEPAAA